MPRHVSNPYNGLKVWRLTERIADWWRLLHKDDNIIFNQKNVTLLAPVDWVNVWHPHQDKHTASGHGNAYTSTSWWFARLQARRGLPVPFPISCPTNHPAVLASPSSPSSDEKGEFGVILNCIVNISRNFGTSWEPSAVWWFGGREQSHWCGTCSLRNTTICKQPLETVSVWQAFKIFKAISANLWYWRQDPRPL